MILKPESIVISSCNKVTRWNYKLKKLLLFNLRLLASGRETFTTHLRMLDMFTSDVTLAKYVHRDEAVELVYEVR